MVSNSEYFNISSIKVWVCDWLEENTKRYSTRLRGKHSSVWVDILHTTFWSEYQIILRGHTYFGYYRHTEMVIEAWKGIFSKGWRENTGDHDILIITHITQRGVVFDSRSCCPSACAWYREEACHPSGCYGFLYVEKYHSYQRILYTTSSYQFHFDRILTYFSTQEEVI